MPVSVSVGAYLELGAAPLAVSHCVHYNLVRVLPRVLGHVDTGVLCAVHLDVGGPRAVPQWVVVLGVHGVDTVQRVAAVLHHEPVGRGAPLPKAR